MNTLYTYTVKRSHGAPRWEGRRTLSLRGTPTQANPFSGPRIVYEHMQGLGLGVECTPWVQLPGHPIGGSIEGSTRPSEIVLMTAHIDDLPRNGAAPGSTTTRAVPQPRVRPQNRWHCRQPLEPVLSVGGRLYVQS